MVAQSPQVVAGAERAGRIASSPLVQRQAEERQTVVPSPNPDTAPVQRWLVNQMGYDLDDNDVTYLQKKYPAQALAIGQAHNSPNGFIAVESPFGVQLVPHHRITEQREKASLTRTAFTSQTQKAVPLKSGQHRRHIISNHLMKLAIGNWQQAHPMEMTHKQAQELLNELNNYKPNLIPGSGPENSAIGMFTNSAMGKLNGAQNLPNNLTSQEYSTNVGVNFGYYSGFQQGTQANLIDDVLPTFSDPNVSMTKGSVNAFATDMVDSTDFDWPEGADPGLYENWSQMYRFFIQIKDHPGNWSKEHFWQVVNWFKSLKKPTK